MQFRAQLATFLRPAVFSVPPPCKWSRWFALDPHHSPVAWQNPGNTTPSALHLALYRGLCKNKCCPDAGTQPNSSPVNYRRMPQNASNSPVSYQSHQDNSNHCPWISNHRANGKKKKKTRKKHIAINKPNGKENTGICHHQWQLFLLLFVIDKMQVYGS